MTPIFNNNILTKIIQRRKLTQTGIAQRVRHWYGAAAKRNATRSQKSKYRLEADMYSAHEVCTILGTTKSTLINWEKDGVIPKPTRNLVGNRRYTIEDISKILKGLKPTQRSRCLVNVKLKIKELNTEMQRLLELVLE